MQKRMQLRGNLMLLLTAMIWGSGFVAQSAGMDYVGPFTMQACRFLLSALVLLPIIALRDRTGKSVNRPVTRGEKKRLLVRGSVCGAACAAYSCLCQHRFSSLALCIRRSENPASSPRCIS